MVKCIIAHFATRFLLLHTHEPAESEGTLSRDTCKTMQLHGHAQIQNYQMPVPDSRPVLLFSAHQVPLPGLGPPFTIH